MSTNLQSDVTSSRGSTNKLEGDEVGKGEKGACGEACRRWSLLCLSHLALDFGLFQRPQQLMQQLAARGHTVSYAGCIGWKETVRHLWHGSGKGNFRGVRYIVHPYSPFGGGMREVSAWHLKKWIRRRLGALEKKRGTSLRVLWFYHPTFAGLAESLSPDIVVYDVMDRFRYFNASRGDVARAEALAYEAADVIFAGGHSLAEAVRHDLQRLGLKKMVHCFPSGVDLLHFEQALAADTPTPPEMKTLQRPVLGYFGAIDERLDFELIAEVARAQPNWSLVFVGPILGALPSLPQNVSFLGARPYSLLPRYLKAFDVCLLPFRQTELVAHVSPTKTPEYLAGGKPVVSTPIPDVMRDYGDIVSFATTAGELIEAVEKLMTERRVPDYWRDAARSRAQTWSQIAEAMEDVISKHIATH